MAIINYYEKYGISPNDELEKIQWVIDQKIIDEENDSFGEGHSDRMFILQLAKEAFATAVSKAKYDQDLADSMKKSDPDGERKASLDKWYADAKNYYSNEQYDLAKTAIDRAMQYATPQTVDSTFYDTVANIYSTLKLFSQALDFHNQSIVLSPDYANGYYLKSITLYNYMFEKNLGSDRMQDIWQQLKTNCELTINKVVAQGHGYNQASKCYEFLAEMHYVYASTGEYGGSGSHFPITGNNNALAEEYALKALQIINAPSSDACPTAKRILDDISARRRQVAELERANSEFERQNAELRNTISSQKSSINNATGYGSTKFGGEAGFGAVAGIVGFIVLVAGGGTFGVVCLIAAIATFAIKGGIIARNIKIRDTLRYIHECETRINENTNKIRQNDSVISRQREGLAPQPIKIPALPTK
jgi:tetratricopeptide (TPR) repeat protein